MVDPTPVFNSPLPITDLLPPPIPLEAMVEGDHPTDNPDGVTVSNVDYSPKTQEEKAELIRVEMVEVLDIAPDKPYPVDVGPSEHDPLKFHTPGDLTPGAEWPQFVADSLKAGGAIPNRED